ncbi:cysteine hydrolase [Tumebacillus sp. ITR2]|uniref:Cysteine hydrolase n=1 Tax=Tumebacillus amylolyticus TaxID=2801339 RepID=A0ABS1JA23_9BACL|nr:cysteine hydrolase family protein [Tumebacillus amylolyticus]MBL0387075.1 cysteine hydrolase [Tumebacillus amylolyticus]
MTNQTAVLVIDAQVGLVEGPKEMYRKEATLERIQSVLTKARTAQLPVLYVQDDDVAPINTPEWEIHPAVAPIDGEPSVRKKATDAFYMTDLHQKLSELGVNHLIIMGFKTEYCIDSACRRATTLGYRVTLVKDAHSTTDNAVLTAEQIVAHHNCNLHGLDNLEQYILVVPADEIQF